MSHKVLSYVTINFREEIDKAAVEIVQGMLKEMPTHIEARDFHVREDTGVMKFVLACDNEMDYSCLNTIRDALKGKISQISGPEYAETGDMYFYDLESEIQHLLKGGTEQDDTSKEGSRN